MQKVTGRGRGEHDQVLDRGNRAKAPRASRKTGNRQPWGGGALECTRDLGGERLSGLKGTLDEMSYSGERELVESTSSRKTRHQVRDGFS